MQLKQMIWYFDIFIFILWKYENELEIAEKASIPFFFLIMK